MSLLAPHMHHGRQPDTFIHMLKNSGGSAAINASSSGAESFFYTATRVAHIGQISVFLAEDTNWLDGAFFADQAAALTNGLILRKTDSTGVNTLLFDRNWKQTREAFVLFHEMNADDLVSTVYSTHTPSVLFYWDWLVAGQKITLQSGDKFEVYVNDNLNAMGLVQLRCRISGYYETLYS